MLELLSSANSIPNWESHPRGWIKKNAQHFCIKFQKVSLLVLSYTSIGLNKMFQGLKWGIVLLCTSKILGDIGKNKIHQFFVFHTFS